MAATAVGQTLTATASLQQLKDVAGGDTLVGSTGSTDFIVVDSSTVVVQGAHTGVSTVTTWTNYALPTGVDDIYEYQVDKTVVGNSGQNLLVANGANDVLNGGGGNDVLVDNGVGGVRFQFNPGAGHDVVYGFQTSGSSQDFIDLGAYGYTNFSQLSTLLSQQGADTLLTLSSTDSILIRNTQASSLNASDFLLGLDTSKMTLTFDDEFNSLSLYNPATGLGTWKTNYAFGTQIGTGDWTSRTLTPNAEQEIYVDPTYAGSGSTALGLNPFSINNGVLTITAAKTPTADLGALNNYQYTSGLLTTQNSFAQTYGYFEMKAELPTGQGVWPAFWLLPENQTGTNELDIMENINGSSSVYNTAHYDTLSGAAQTQWASVVSGLSTGFHTYGLLWTAQSLVWYIDGKAVAEMATPAGLNQPMYLLVNLAVGGTWPGAPSASFTSAQMEIDYVRAYSLNGSLTTGAAADSAVAAVTTYTATSSTDVPTSATIDSISSAFSYTLPTSFAHTLTLTGSANLTATGNALGDHIIGNTGADALIGGVGSDVIDASAGGASLLNGGPGGIDTLIGGAGADTFVVANASDVVTAVAGYQNVVQSSVSFQLPSNIVAGYLTGSANLSLWANSSGDKLYANSGNDVLYGGAGNDSFVTGAGIDTLVAGGGTDTFFIQNSADVILGIAPGGGDVVQSQVSYRLPDNAAKLVLTGSANLTGWSNGTGATLSANAGNDLLIGGLGPDSFVSGSGIDTMVGGAGADSYFVQNSADVISPGTGTSTVWSNVSYRLPGNIQLGGLTGSANLDLWAGAGAALIYGNAGNNHLYAGSGSDTLSGGAGNDTFVFGLASGKGWINGFDQTVGQQDVVDISAFLQAGDSATLTQVGGNTLITMSTGETITLGSIQATALTITSNGYVVQSAGPPVLTGSSANDVFTVTVAGTTVVETAVAGNDTVYSYVDFVLPANVDTLALFGQATHATGNSQNDTLIANQSLASILTGGSGNDTFIGGAGQDTMIGGGGNDVFIVYNSGATVVEAANSGSDTVDSYANFALPANVNTLALFGQATHATGNSQGDTLIANQSLASVLTGGSGNDTFIGGAGQDTMIGGGGNDVFIVYNSGAAVVEAANSGNDTVYSYANFVLPANVNTLALLGQATHATGNSQGDTLIANQSLASVLIGGSGNDTFIGGAGQDTMIGGGGNDVFIVYNSGATVVEAANSGNDTVYSYVDYVLPSNVNTLALLGQATHATGNSQGDTLIANQSLASVLTGGSGNDTFIGGAGQDTMIGGGGNDVFIVYNSGATVVEAANSGSDTVYSYVDYVLPSNVNTLALLGQATHATGNSQGDTLIANQSLASVLTGGSGNDTFIGGAGQDTMIGGGGNDVFIVYNSGAAVVEAANSGNDSVYSYANFVLPANVDTLALLGQATHATGNSQGDTLIANQSLASVLTGGSGNDTFIGGAGQDTMIGGGGNDVFIVYNSGATVLEAANSGNDTVHSYANFVLPANVDTLALFGQATHATGNNQGDTLSANQSLASVLTGGSGNDTFIGGASQDTMIGGGGNDVFIVYNSGATLVEAANSGNDTVYSYANFVLPANVNTLALLGQATHATGNSQNDTLIANQSLASVLTGGSGNDTFIGGAGQDTFVFGVNSGHDTITNFGLGGHEVIDLSAYFNAGDTASVANIGGQAQITLSTGASITLVGVQASDLTATTTGYMHR